MQSKNSKHLDICLIDLHSATLHIGYIYSKMENLRKFLCMKTIRTQTRISTTDQSMHGNDDSYKTAYIKCISSLRIKEVYFFFILALDECVFMYTSEKVTTIDVV